MCAQTACSCGVLARAQSAMGGERGNRVLITGYTAGTQEQTQETVRTEGELCAGCFGPFLEGDTPPHFEGGWVLHSRLTCALALLARRAVEGAGASGAEAQLAGCHLPAGDRPRGRW